MKAFWIDSPNRLIREVDYDGDFKSISRDWLKCDYFDVVRLEDMDAIYVDDEGLMNGNQHGWFGLVGYPNPLKGYGLVLGADDAGDTKPPAIPITRLATLVRFPTEEESILLDMGVLPVGWG